MLELIKAIAAGPLPSLLAFGGIILLVLGFTGGITGPINLAIPAGKQGVVTWTGGFLVLLSIILYALPITMSISGSGTAVTVTPTPTPTPSYTPTNIFTPTSTPTATPTSTPTSTPTATPTSTPTPTITLTPTRTRTPTPVVMLFQDFELGNGTPDRPGNYFWDAWRITCSYSESPNPVLQGARAAHCDTNPNFPGVKTGDSGGTVGINPASPEPLDLSHATTISVWVYDTQGRNTLELKLRDEHDQQSNPIWSKALSVRNQWTPITWVLSEFKNVNLSRIKNIELYERNDGTYYFDLVTYR